MISFIRSVFYFIYFSFKKRKLDILFYYPHHFNRGENGENLFLEHLYNSCKKNNLSFLVFEEPDIWSKKVRNKTSIPFDFIYFIIIFLRKLRVSDFYIGKILSKTILRGLIFKNCIVMSQSMLSIFRSINPDAKLFDLQHGIIYSSQESYIKENKPAINLTRNSVYLLLNGIGYRDVLLKQDKSGYFENSAHVLGVPKTNYKILHDKPNKNILVTLQLTEDHSKQQNQILLQDLEIFIKNYKEYNFYLRHHPRFNNDLDLRYLLKYKNVILADNRLDSCFEKCSIHLTSYSTTTFESAAYGIPTVFLTSLKEEFDMFSLDFNYPIKNNLRFIEDNYLLCSKKVFEWQSYFYNRFNEDKFLSILK